MKKFFPCIVLPVVLFLLPITSFAHTPDLFPSGFWGPIVSCGAPIKVTTTGTGNDRTTQAEPNDGACLSLCDLVHTLIHLIVFGMSLALYAGAPVLFAWGGILILISAGNPGKISEGKKILTGTLIGILIILLAYLIIKTLIDTLGIAYIPFGVFDCVVK